MATPGSVELDQNVLAVVVNDGVKVLRHHHLQTNEAGAEASSLVQAQQNLNVGCEVTLTGPSLLSGTGSDFRYGFREPSK